MAFQAEYVGVCQCGCNEYFDRGDWIEYDADIFGYVIEGHKSKDEVALPLCTKCFIELPMTGQCEFCN